MKVKVCYIISDITKALAFEWICTTIDRNKIDLQFLLLGQHESPLISFLQKNGFVCHVVPLLGKKDFFTAWWSVFSILKKERPQSIHTHLYYANLIGLTAAWLLRIPQRIHTRHHGSLHHHYFPWAVRIDKFLNTLSTQIICLCSRQQEILIKWEKASESKVHLIPHGFDLTYFQSSVPERVTSIQNRHGIPKDSFPVIGIISRYTEWKGIQFSIPAFKELLDHYPKAHLVLANARGDYSPEIKKILSTLPGSNYSEIAFEPDLASLYGLFNVFVHTPVDEYAEAFGQTYIESLAGGVPSVFTLSGIACDFIEHKRNALVVPHRSTKEISQAMEEILSSDALRIRLRENGLKSVAAYDIRKMVSQLETLYLR